MAYVTGPLHSEKASGQIAKSAIYQTYKNRTFVRGYAVPGNTPGHDKMNQSDAQLAHQAQFAAIAAAWVAASDSDKTSWAAIADQDRITNYAAYTRENWKRVLSGREITTVWPPAAAFPVDAELTKVGDPPWEPDITGNFHQIEDIDLLPAYQHNSLNYWVFHTAFYGSYVISDNLDLGSSVHAWVNGSHDAEGSYVPLSQASGEFQLTLV
jgi:hypothetical protein